MEKVEAFSFMNDEDIYKYRVTCNYSRGTLITAHISDLHFPTFDSKRQYEILKEQFVKSLYALPRLDVLCVNGDIFEHKVLSSSEGALYATMIIGEMVELCRKKNATLILLHGTLSHDSNQLKLFYHYISDPTVDVRIITTIQFQYVKGAKVLCIPEMYGVDESVYSEYLLYSGVYDFAIMHGMFQGVVAGNDSNSREFRIEDFCNCRGPILSGHVHKPGCFKGYFYYSGSPYRWRFDDDHKKGYLMMVMNLDNSSHYCHFCEIVSDTYRTIELDSIINEDPRIVIECINRLKQDEGVNYLKIRFNTPINGSNKTIINNYYRNSKDIFVEFLDIEKEASKRRESEMEDEMKEYEFVFNGELSEEQKLCQYANLLKGYQYITVDELIDILSSDI